MTLGDKVPHPFVLCVVFKCFDSSNGVMHLERSACKNKHLNCRTYIVFEASSPWICNDYCTNWKSVISYYRQYCTCVYTLKPAVIKKNHDEMVCSLLRRIVTVLWN